MQLRALLIIAATLASLGSATPPTYRVRRSAVVPHPAPPDWTGQPMRKAVELRARSSTVVVPVEPSEEPGANAGLYVARTNLGATLHGRASENWALGLGFDVGLSKSAMQIADDATKPPDEGPTRTWRASARYSVPLEGGWRLGLGGSLGLLRAPYRETGECIANCGGVPRFYEESGTKTVGVASGSAVVSYREGPLTVFGGVTAQNHPRNTKNGTVVLREDDSDDELSSGPAYVLVGGGLEWQATDDVKFLGHVHQPVSTEIANYGPVLGASIAFDFGQRTERRRASSVQTAQRAGERAGLIRVQASPGAREQTGEERRTARAHCAPRIATWRRATDAAARARIYATLPAACRTLVDAAHTAD